MTYDDVITMLEEAGLPLAYDHFAEGESPDPPCKRPGNRDPERGHLNRPRPAL